MSTMMMPTPHSSCQTLPVPSMSPMTSNMSPMGPGMSSIHQSRMGPYTSKSQPYMQSPTSHLSMMMPDAQSTSRRMKIHSPVDSHSRTMLPQAAFPTKEGSPKAAHLQSRSPKHKKMTDRAVGQSPNVKVLRERSTRSRGASPFPSDKMTASRLSASHSLPTEMMPQHTHLQQEQTQNFCMGNNMPPSMGMMPQHQQQQYPGMMPQHQQQQYPGMMPQHQQQQYPGMMPQHMASMNRSMNPRPSGMIPVIPVVPVMQHPRMSVMDPNTEMMQPPTQMFQMHRGSGFNEPFLQPPLQQQQHSLLSDESSSTSGSSDLSTVYSSEDSSQKLHPALERWIASYPRNVPAMTKIVVRPTRSHKRQKQPHQASRNCTDSSAIDSAHAAKMMYQMKEQKIAQPEQAVPVQPAAQKKSACGGCGGDEQSATVDRAGSTASMRRRRFSRIHDAVPRYQHQRKGRANSQSVYNEFYRRTHLIKTEQQPIRPAPKGACG